RSPRHQRGSARHRGENLRRQLAQEMRASAALASGEDIALLVADPHWFLEDYNVGTRKLRFVCADRNTLASTPFLAEGMWDYSALPQREVAENELLGLLPANAPAPRIHFLWHTAFCCSTLIASLLDRGGVNLSLKEPGILLILADAKRQGAIG